MKELDEIIAALEASTTSAVLATVVGVAGSTYRRPGARLLILPDGKLVGNISGGCLEGELVHVAPDVLSSSRAQLLRFDLTSDDALWGWGMGCNGVIDVLVEPTASAIRFAAVLGKARRAEQSLALVTVVSGERVGARLFVHPTGETEGTLGTPDLDRVTMEAAVEAIQTAHRATVSLPGGAVAVVEVIQPRLRLIVCGASPDATALVELAARLGWRVDIADDRPGLLTRERFPQAHRLFPTQPADAAEAVAADERSYVVVMSHNEHRDAGYLQSFAARPVAYLGLLGPATRRARLVEALLVGGAPPESSTLARIHGPAGLDLGAEGPDEIALAIVAEILAIQRGGGAGFLRSRGGPIHAQA